MRAASKYGVHQQCFEQLHSLSHFSSAGVVVVVVVVVVEEMQVLLQPARHPRVLQYSSRGPSECLMLAHMIQSVLPTFPDKAVEELLLGLEVQCSNFIAAEGLVKKWRLVRKRSK